MTPYEQDEAWVAKLEHEHEKARLAKCEYDQAMLEWENRRKLIWWGLTPNITLATFAWIVVFVYVIVDKMFPQIQSDVAYFGIFLPGVIIIALLWKALWGWVQTRLEPSMPIAEDFGIVDIEF